MILFSHDQFILKEKQLICQRFTLFIACTLSLTDSVFIYAKKRKTYCHMIGCSKYSDRRPSLYTPETINALFSRMNHCN